MGKGHRAMETFCGFMNMPSPMTKKANSMKQAADELREVVLRDEFTDEAVADTVCRYICRWLVAKKRVTSLNGFVTITCLLTGKCLDFAAMCKPCKSCETWEK